MACRKFIGSTQFSDSWKVNCWYSLIRAMVASSTAEQAQTHVVYQYTHDARRCLSKLLTLKRAMARHKKDVAETGVEDNFGCTAEVCSTLTT